MYYLGSYDGFSYEMLHMYDVEKHSNVLENAVGFVRLDAYTYGPITKWRHWGVFIWNATVTKFLEVQILPRVIVFDLDL